MTNLRAGKCFFISRHHLCYISDKNSRGRTSYENRCIKGNVRFTVILTYSLQHRIIMISKIFLVCFISMSACLAVPLEQMLTLVEARNCPAGFYCVSDDRTRTVTPKPCQPGTFSGPGSSKCSQCLAGESTTRPGSSYCDICPIGHSCAVASSNPEPCSLGTSNPFMGKTNCYPCEVGDYTPGLQTVTCSACPHGSYCADPAEQPKKCPPGRYDFDNNIFS